MCYRPALLCFFDTWYPGWEVTVDGIEMDLERVNYAFKGVFVGQGEHEVVFSYNPRLVLYGLVGTIIGLIITLVIGRPLSILAEIKENKHSTEENS